MKNNQKVQRFTGLVFSLCLLGACTEPGETTYVGSATGGVIGAGLGAIIGNQTGNPGSGLAIGAMAGAGTGAAIGNALEAQQKAIRTQDEALERQQKILAAQNAEIQELRGGAALDMPATDSSEMRGSFARDRGIVRDGTASTSSASLTDQLNRGMDINSAGSRPVNSQSYENTSYNAPSAATTADPQRDTAAIASALQETDLRVASAANAATTVNAAASTTAAIHNDGIGSPECQKAQSEVQKAENANEGADKLFYLRRAIRLCPSKAIYHKKLADQYLSLGRNEDAKTAYSDALRLDPTMTEAGEAMSAISSNNVY